MILKIDNTSVDFYVIMGKYFADRSFIKEMDCQLYDNNCEWYLYYSDNTLCGFASIEDKGKYHWLDNFYVFEAYRNKGIGTQIIEKVLMDYSNIRLITRNENAIRIFKKFGFREYGQNGRYRKMVKE